MARQEPGGLQARNARAPCAHLQLRDALRQRRVVCLRLALAPLVCAVLVVIHARVALQLLENGHPSRRQPRAQPRLEALARGGAELGLDLGARRLGHVAAEAAAALERAPDARLQQAALLAREQPHLQCDGNGVSMQMRRRIPKCNLSVT